MVPSFSERKKKIIAVICEIPPGQVASYGQVAELAGIPRGARLVVRVLRDPGAEAEQVSPKGDTAKKVSPKGDTAKKVSPKGGTAKKVSPKGEAVKRALPWWRVLRADGSCAVEGQLARLRSEGVIAEKRVDLARYRWQGLDYLLFGDAQFSEPLIDCSKGEATVSAMVLGFAPG